MIQIERAIGRVLIAVIGRPFDWYCEAMEKRMDDTPRMVGFVILLGTAMAVAVVGMIYLIDMLIEELI